MSAQTELERAIFAAHERYEKSKAAADYAELLRLQKKFRSTAVVSSADRGQGAPRIELKRAMEFRSPDGAMPTMAGHFAVFNQWTEIRSPLEGHFMERVAPGAFARTFAENRRNIRVTLNHGTDPMAGNKPLGPIAELREDNVGAYYEVPLLDTAYNREIVPGLRAGLYGASFSFQVTKEDFDPKPVRSTSNPQSLPERTIRETAVLEFGPVTFPAYAGATAGVRGKPPRFKNADWQAWCESVRASAPAARTHETERPLLILSTSAFEKLRDARYGKEDGYWLVGPRNQTDHRIVEARRALWPAWESDRKPDTLSVDLSEIDQINRALDREEVLAHGHTQPHSSDPSDADFATWERALDRSGRDQFFGVVLAERLNPHAGVDIQAFSVHRDGGSVIRRKADIHVRNF